MHVRGARSAIAIAMVIACSTIIASCGGSPTTPANKSALTLADTAVTFVSELGTGDPAAQTVAITNGGSGTLSGLSLGTVTYGGGASGWLSATLSGASAPATISLKAKAGQLAVGLYTATVPVTAAGGSPPRSLVVAFNVAPVAGTTTLSAAGVSQTFLTNASFATNLAVTAGARYLIAVVNTDTSSAVNEDFTLFGATLGGGAQVVTAMPPRRALVRAAVATTARAPRFELGPNAKRLASLKRMQANHLRMLDRNRTMVQQFRAAGRLSAASAAPRQRAQGAISQTIGTVNKIYIASSFGGTCTDVDSIGARTVAVGQHIIVLADTNRTLWPDSLRDSAFYQTFANEYDAVTFPHIKTFIGDPLALDAQLSGLGKVTVTISPVLNNFGGGIVAFVNSCDFFPVVAPGKANADLDNFTEMFYYFAPDPKLGWTISGGNPWGMLMRATAAHETKHIVSYTDRLTNNSPSFEERWLEEGLAQESSEIWERNFSHVTWKGNANFDQTVGCEIFLGPNGPQCNVGNNNPIALTGSHLPFLFDYLNAESTSPTGLGFGNAGNNATPTNYGAGWEFARWATDQYATSEATFIQSLVNDPTLTGMANVSQHTGKTVQELLVYWNLATAIFDTATYTAADVRTTIPSFNFGNIFFVAQSDLTCGGTPCGLFTQSGKPVFPIQPDTMSTGPISATVTGMPGTTASYFLLSAPAAGTQYLQLLSGTGGALSTSSGLRVGIIRVK